MSISLFDASVPVCQRYLDRLLVWIELAQTHVDAMGTDPALVVSARLAPDMLPLETQVTIAANFALRACFPLAGKPVPPYGEFEASWAGMTARIQRTKGLLGNLTTNDFEGASARTVQADAGETRLTLASSPFLFEFALPNFFFHLSIAYALLRAQGVLLSKADFDGFHVYDQPSLSLAP